MTRRLAGATISRVRTELVCLNDRLAEAITDGQKERPVEDFVNILLDEVRIQDALISQESGRRRLISRHAPQAK